MSMQIPNPEEDYYWALTLKDDRVINISPKGVPVVQRKMAAKEPIQTKWETIPFSEIKGFSRTSRRFTDVPLLEETARALNEPIINAEGEVKARWVKKDVTRSEYDKYYSKSSSYRFLAETEGMVKVALVVPTHKINFQIHEYCTPEEERKLGL